MYVSAFGAKSIVNSIIYFCLSLQLFFKNSCLKIAEFSLEKQPTLPGIKIDVASF